MNTMPDRCLPPLDFWSGHLALAGSVTGLRHRSVKTILAHANPRPTRSVDEEHTRGYHIKFRETLSVLVEAEALI